MRTTRDIIVTWLLLLCLLQASVVAQPGGPAPPPNDWQKLEQQKQAERLKLSQAKTAMYQARVAETRKNARADARQKQARPTNAKSSPCSAN